MIVIGVGCSRIQEQQGQWGQRERNKLNPTRGSSSGACSLMRRYAVGRRHRRKLGEWGKGGEQPSWKSGTKKRLRRKKETGREGGGWVGGVLLKQKQKARFPLLLELAISPLCSKGFSRFQSFSPSRSSFRPLLPNNSASPCLCPVFLSQLLDTLQSQPNAAGHEEKGRRPSGQDIRQARKER